MSRSQPWYHGQLSASLHAAGSKQGLESRLEAVKRLRQRLYEYQVADFDKRNQLMKLLQQNEVSTLWPL